MTPITAIASLPDAADWWRLLGIEPLDLVGVPDVWGARMRELRATVWTHADFRAGLSTVEDTSDVPPPERGELINRAVLREGRLPNLQVEFKELARQFDLWLEPRPQVKRGSQRVRVLWLQHGRGPYRSKAYLACLSRGRINERNVCDAGSAMGTLVNAIGATDPVLGTRPPLVAVDLDRDPGEERWHELREVLAELQNRFPTGDDTFPRLVIGGTVEQARAAMAALNPLIEMTPIDPGGRIRPRPAGQDPGPLLPDVYIKGLPATTPVLVGRTSELEVLRDAWASKRTRIVSVVAYGGTGKSALVNTWFSELREQGYGAAQKVLAWSFYSQGTKENLVSADLFVGEALAWLGDAEAAVLNPAQKGQRLASLIKKHNCLLVLDGVEPLQHPLSAPDVGGRLTDSSMSTLLEELAAGDWSGLCVVTTRVPLTDLRPFEEDRGSKAPTAIRLDLRNLDDKAGAALLGRILQRSYEFRELQPVVREVEGHALAITLLGNYLRDAHRGDLAGRYDLKELTVEVSDGGHARRVMDAYVRWLERAARADELALLLVIGLFDRPAEPEAMRALVGDTNLRPFMGHLDRVGGDVWNRCVDALRSMGLLNAAMPDWPGALDAHPLVREHFRARLVRPDRRNLWLEGNRTLFTYYSDLAPEQPEDVRGMGSLYAAVTHGCAAEQHQEVFDDILVHRVWRDRRTNYSTRHLGMTGADLVALSNYFRHRWHSLQDRPLTSRARVLILTNAGVRLRQLGRLRDARECFAAVVAEIDDASASPEELEDVAYAAAQNCELLVIAGNLTGDGPASALANGERAIAFGDRGRDAYFKMHARSSLGEVYYMLGDLDRARRQFEAAMQIEAEHRPRPPFLYSQSLFRYGYFLIETNRPALVIEQAERDPTWGTNGADSSLLSRAIRLLVLGAANRALVQAGDRSPERLVRTEQILDESIVAFRDAGYADYLVRGLIERVHFYRVRHGLEDLARALADLERAQREVDRGDMGLLEADVLLQRVACYLEFWPAITNTEREEHHDTVEATLDRATELVDRTIGYGRRLAELAELRSRAAVLGIGSSA